VTEKIFNKVETSNHSKNGATPKSQMSRKIQKQTVMRNSYILLVTLILLMASCKKNSDEDSLNSTWTINGKSYSAVKTIYSVADDALTASDNNDIDKAENSVTLYFQEKPISNGTYDIINWGIDGAPYKGEVDMEISIKSSTGYTTYYSPGYDFGYKATVSLKNNKLNIVFNDITFHDDLNNKVNASGIIIEQ